jgi:hypothetical protein
MWMIVWISVKFILNGIPIIYQRTLIHISHRTG